ncbi:MAG TPA: protein kinase, partial [Kofleriaceae bacterium]|nr:protein kinase [Kofleriaceae bacterium]
KAEERATKTMGGTIKGKYGYMSPEQCKGKPIDRRSDIFALGIVLYELTTLRRAFKGNDDFETMRRIVAGDLVLPTTIVPHFPRELEAIILTALAGDPAARFQTAQEMIEALDAFTVRAKLTGTNTAMGRFMVQLFGTKKEPWIEAPAAIVPGVGDHTVVTPHELLLTGGAADAAEAEVDDDDGENDETLVVSNRQDVQRVLEAVQPVKRPSAIELAVAGADESARPSTRRSAERPSLPFAAASPDRTPPPTTTASGAYSAPMSTGGYGVPVAPPAAQTHQAYPPVTGPHLIAPGAAPPMPPASYAPPAHTQPPAYGQAPASHPGASTMLGPAPVVMPGHAAGHSQGGLAMPGVPPIASREAGEPAVKLRSNLVWIAIGIVLAVVSAGVIVLLMRT